MSSYTNKQTHRITSGSNKRPEKTRAGWGDRSDLGKQGRHAGALAFELRPREKMPLMLQPGGRILLAEGQQA